MLSAKQNLAKKKLQIGKCSCLRDLEIWADEDVGKNILHQITSVDSQNNTAAVDGRNAPDAIRSYLGEKFLIEKKIGIGIEAIGCFPDARFFFSEESAVCESCVASLCIICLREKKIQRKSPRE